MKILLVSLWSISPDKIGGTERFVIDMARGLSRNHSVTVLSLGRVDPKMKGVTTEGLGLIKNLDEYSLAEFLERGGCAKIQSTIASFIEKRDFDVVHLNSLLFSGLPIDIPSIHTVHTNKTELLASFSRKMIGGIVREVQNDGEAVYVAPSIFAGRSFKALTGRDPVIIRHSFFPDIALRNKMSAKRRYGIPEKNLVFCVPSRLELEQKGQEILLRALKRVRPQLPPFVVVLGGSDKQYADTRRYLLNRYHGLNMVIEAFPSKDEMYSLADIIVLPSKTESFGYAALESAMMGFPLFLSNIPPYREMADGNPRITIFENNGSGLAKKLLAHLDEITNPGIEPPPKKWMAKFSQEIMTKKYLALYKKVMLHQ